MPNLFPGREQLPRLPKYLAGLALAPLQVARLARIFQVMQPDILNAHYVSVPALYARLATAIRSRSRLVVSVHGSDLAARPFPTGSAALSRFVVRGACAATAPSESQAELLRRFMGADWAGPVVVTGNGVAAAELEASEAHMHPRPYVFAAARLTPVKGLDVLIRALKQLVDAGRDVDLILAGAGPQEGVLQALARELGIERRVVFWGIAGRQDIARLLHGCAVYALPSRAESFGIAALEAMACGKPVVASRCGGVPEVVRDGETGLLVSPGDPAALAAALAALLADPQRCEVLGQRGRDIAAQEWSWSAVADRYLQAYTIAEG